MAFWRLFSARDAQVAAAHVPEAKGRSISENYNAYYEGGQKSLYSTRYNDIVLPRDASIIRNAWFQILAYRRSINATSEPIRVLDYGCGDGRYLRCILDLAGEKANGDAPTELVMVDPSPVGLQTFKEKLAQADFAGSEIVQFKDDANLENAEVGKKGYLAGVMTRKTVTVRLIHMCIDDDMEHLTKLIGDVDMIICMFGVLSHIPGQTSRVSVLKMFSKVAKSGGKLVVSVPGPQLLRAQQKLYDIARESGSDVQDAREAGDIYYTMSITSQDPNVLPKAVTITNFLHIYRASELDTDLRAAGFAVENGVQVNYILDIRQLISSRWLSIFDHWVSWLISFIAYRTPGWLQSMLSIDYFTTYWIAVAHRDLLPR